MDGAAKKVNRLVEQILPPQPHHLSLSLTQRYPAPTSFWQHNSRLQYTTYVSGADRGVLVTRAAYEIHEEADDTMAASNPASRTDTKKAVTKMSFKDYQQNKQKKLSESPPDSSQDASVEARQSRGVDPRQPKDAEHIDSSRARDGDEGHGLTLNGDGSVAVLFVYRLGQH